MHESTYLRERQSYKRQKFFLGILEAIVMTINILILKRNINQSFTRCENTDTLKLSHFASSWKKPDTTVSVGGNSKHPSKQIKYFCIENIYFREMPPQKVLELSPLKHTAVGGGAALCGGNQEGL